MKDYPVILCMDCKCILNDVMPDKRSKYSYHCPKMPKSVSEAGMDFKHYSQLELYMIEKYGDYWKYGLNTL